MAMRSTSFRNAVSLSLPAGTDKYYCPSNVLSPAELTAEIKCVPVEDANANQLAPGDYCETTSQCFGRGICSNNECQAEDPQVGADC